MTNKIKDLSILQPSIFGGASAPMSEACYALGRIKDLSAFNIPEAIRRTKVNQHLTRYDFSDYSNLYVFSTSSWAVSRKNGIGLRRSNLNINKQGN